MSPEEQAEIFRICLQAIEEGSATLDQCAARYPAMADLREMLEVSLLAQQMPRVTLPTAATRRGISGWLRLPLALTVGLLIALGTGGVLVQASQSALPGDTLYGIKRSVERVQLSMANDQSRPAVMSTIATTRLNELSTMIDRGVPVAASFWNDVTSSLYIAASVQIDPAIRDDLYARGEGTLYQLKQTGNRPDLADSLDVLLKTIVTPTPTLPSLPETLSSPTASPTSSLTPEATMTVVTATATVEVTLSPSPSATLIAGPTAMALPSLSPSSTPNLEPLRAAIRACVTDRQILQPLLVKIDVDQLGAFINEVKAQSGKKIQAACANQLIAIAQTMGN